MCRHVNYKPTEALPVNYSELTPFRELMQDAGYYLGQIGAGFGVKVPTAAVSAWYTQFLGGDWILLAGFWILFFSDLVLGSWVAVRHGKFSILRLRKWVIKLLTYGACIVIVGLISSGFVRASGLAVPLLDFFLLVLLATEALSIFSHMDKLGWPVPSLARRLAQGIHDKSCEKIDQVTEVKKKHDD